MIYSILKIAARNILKHRGFSIINISGLAIGIACSMLIFIFVRYERSYDNFHQKKDRIFRLAVSALIGDTKIDQTSSSAMTFRKLLEDFPEVESGVKIYNNERTPVVVGDETFYEKRLLSVDSTFFNLFSIPLIHGNPQDVLAEPNSIVLSKSTALKYFEDTNVVGRNVAVNFSSSGRGIINFVITGISEDVPANSHFHYDVLISLITFPDRVHNTGWFNNNFTSYLLLQDGASKAALEEKFDDFTRKYMGEKDYDEWVARGNYWEYYLQPLTDIHLHSDLNGEFEANGNATYVNIFSVISIFILLVASINFMNLSTARTSVRAKEVGMKRVVGCSRRHLIFQFLSESILTTVLALILSLLIVQVLLPSYANLVERPLEINYFDNLVVIPSLLGLALLLGIFSGAYPAFFLSSFKPLTVLQSRSTKASGNSWFRNTLVIIQFAISIFLIIGTLTVYRQLEFFQNKQLGFEKDQVLVVNNPGALIENVDPFKEELSNHSNILVVSGSNFLPGKDFSNIGFGAKGVEESFTLNIGVCDYNFAETLDLEMASGRYFSRDFISDSNAVVINQKTAELLNWEDPIGKELNNWSRTKANFYVVGVVQDFHYESLHQQVRPMALFLEGGYYKRVQSNISIRLNTKDVQGTIAFIEDKWKDFVPGKPFEYSFLDQDYDKLYVNESRIKKVFTIFSVLSILIASMGLFGLASFITERKIKEIGIRKVLGASVPGIVNLLNQGFVKWIVISSLVAWPVAGYLMNNWLQNFAYRIELPWWIFAIASALALVLTLTIVSLQTVKAALKNPVDSLRSS